MFAPDSLGDRFGALLMWPVYALVVAAGLVGIAAVIAAQVYLMLLLL